LSPSAAQVLPKGQDWFDVPYLPDAYVINLGDLMARWTNDRWVSTLHRVVTPPLDAGRPCRRQSMAFFHNINPDHMVKCIETCQSPTNPPKYEPIKAFDLLMQKHLASLGYK
jgi:isopenicillin N synthase-like dioxygenase